MNEHCIGTGSKTNDGKDGKTDRSGEVMVKSLELLVDFRSGKKMELVVPTKSESKNRLLLLKRTYGEIVDIVLLDDDADQELLNFCSLREITLYKRLVDVVGGEVFFKDYCNDHSLSNRAFWYHADEFIKPADLRRAIRELDTFDVVKIRRVDYLYGDRWLTSQGGYDFRIFKNKCVDYDSGRLHGSLRKSDKATCSPFVPDLFHLHPISISVYLGTPGRYAAREFEFLPEGNGGGFFLLKRFGKPIFGSIYRYLKREKKYRWRDFFYMLSLGLISFFSAVMVWASRKYGQKNWEQLFLNMREEFPDVNGDVE